MVILLQVEVVEPALKGTLNVLKACSESKVRRVVIVSSVVAVIVNPSWPKDQVMDESCWSDMEYCKATNVRNSDFSLANLYGILILILLYRTGIIIQKQWLRIRRGNMPRKAGWTSWLCVQALSWDLCCSVQQILAVWLSSSCWEVFTPNWVFCCYLDH